MKRTVRWLTISLALLALAGMCFSQSVTIVFWHSYRGLEKDALEEVGANFTKAHPEIRIQFLQVPFDALPDKITAAVPRGKGPDVFIFGHDRVGYWADKKVLEPLGLWVKKDMSSLFMPSTLEALTYEDALYGLPTSLKCLCLIYNRKLVKAPPKDTAEMIALAKKNTDVKQNKFGLAYEIGLTYYNSAWLFGFGGGIFDKNDDPIINSPGNVKALNFVYDLYRKQNVMPEEITNTLVTTLFNRGQAAMVLSGPWFLGEIEKGVDYAVAPLPLISEIKAKPRPFLTVEAMFMSSQSQRKKEAFEVIKYFTSKEALVVMAKKGGQPVANLQAYDDPAVKNHPFIPVFKLQAETAVPMPNIAEMMMVWTPFDLAIGKVLNRTAKPKEALDEAQGKIAKDIQTFRQ
ncbi:MAG TPA: extracellular solute-binding protein [Candidatus Aminicenantes bacterium]|nr:extracellular solute-binding protein [Candidatus Aminicenantes bacterium]